MGVELYSIDRERPEFRAMKKRTADRPGLIGYYGGRIVFDRVRDMTINDNVQSSRRAWLGILNKEKT